MSPARREAWRARLGSTQPLGTAFLHPRDPVSFSCIYILRHSEEKGGSAAKRMRTLVHTRIKISSWGHSGEGKERFSPGEGKAAHPTTTKSWPGGATPSGESETQHPLPGARSPRPEPERRAHPTASPAMHSPVCALAPRNSLAHVHKE